MKINLEEILFYIENENLSELSRRTGISYRTMQDWKNSQNNWLNKTIKRFEVMQRAVRDMKNEFEIDGTSHRFYGVSNLSTKNKNRYTALVELDGYEKQINIERKYAVAYIDRNHVTDDMMIKIENQLDFEFTDNPYVFKFGKDEYLTSTIEIVANLGHTAIDIRTGIKTFFFTNLRQVYELSIIKETFENLSDYSQDRIMNYFADEFGFENFSKSDDKLIEEIWHETKDGLQTII